MSKNLTNKDDINEGYSEFTLSQAQKAIKELLLYFAPPS